MQNTWTPVPPPPGWANIGDAPCAVLRDGRLLLGDINSTRTVIYDPVAGTWSGTGTKGDRSSEETWTLLRDGSVLTVECNPTYPMASQRYVPATGTWVDAGSTQTDLVAHSFSTEIGPAILLEDGRVIAFGGTGHTAIYTPDHGAGSWSAGPDFPVGGDGQLMTVRDAPACLFPNGRVLCCAGLATGGQGWGGPPAFFEFDPATDLLNRSRPPRSTPRCPTSAACCCCPPGKCSTRRPGRHRDRHPGAAGAQARGRGPGAGDHRGARAPHPRQPPQGMGAAVQRGHRRRSATETTAPRRLTTRSRGFDTPTAVSSTGAPSTIRPWRSRPGTTPCTRRSRFPPRRPQATLTCRSSPTASHRIRSRCT